MSEDHCALCGRTDVDEHWVWLRLERQSVDVDCEFDETELSFCSQAHAGQFLTERELEWPEHDQSERTAGTRVDTFFLGCGLLAIILSVVGIVALARWIF